MDTKWSLSDDYKSTEKDSLHILNMDPIEAVELIMNNYGNEIMNFAYTYVNNTVDAEDVTQEVFVTVYLKLSTFKGDSTIKSWIYSIAANKCKDYLRKHRLRHNKLMEKIIKQQKVNEATVSTANSQSTLEEYLFEKILELPIKYREVIILYYYKELPIKEIGFILKIKEATLQSRLLRGRKKLRDLIQERGIELG